MIQYNIISFSAICILCTILQSNCCANSLTNEISVKCSPTQRIAEKKPEFYPGILNSTLSLTTIGLKVKYQDDQKNLIMITDEEEINSLLLENPISITAECTLPNGDHLLRGYSEDMFPLFLDPVNPSPTLRCNQGEGIRIVMSYPNDPDPNKYQYIANLTIDYQDSTSPIPIEKSYNSPRYHSPITHHSPPPPKINLDLNEAYLRHRSSS